MPEPGALSASGRFDRMEAALLRIESKLDAKVDRSELELLTRRIDAVESGNTPLARLQARDLEDLTAKLNQQVTQVNELVVNGREEVAVTKATANRITGRYRLLGGAVAVVTIANAAINLFTLAN